MDYIKIIEIIATITTLIGIPIISIPRISGMYILCISTIFWIIFSYLVNYNWLLIQSVYILFFDIYSIYSWTKRGIKF
jgi:nicotinamide riboside transporter PnuC